MSENVPPSTPWEQAKERRYAEQEKRTASKEGGRPQRNSGRVWHSLRDVTLKSFLGKLLIDNKTTEAKSYTITRSDWEALKRDANRTPPGCLPVLQIDIQSLSLIVFEEGTWDEIVRHVLLLEKKVSDADST